MAQSYSPGGAHVQPIYRKTKMIAMATSLSCRVSQYMHFVGRPRPLKPPFVTNYLVHNSNSISIDSAVFAQTVGCLSLKPPP